jgi:hypothetical protein
MKGIKVFILLMVSGLCHAQYSNHQLYQAYLDQDVTIWGEYIASTEWDSLTIEEKKQLINYEYGYTAVVLGKDKEQAKERLQHYEQHLQAMKDVLPPARYEAYMASVYTYKMSLERNRLISHAKNLFACISRIKELDTRDALALSMLGNVEFYAPTGSKKRALEYFLQADSVYSVQAEEYERWNHQAVKMTIEQCKDKLNKR